MKEIKAKELGKESKDWLVETCLARFGSMNKNDYEVALFTLLLKNEWASKSDFEISCKLGITEAKVKKLRYESSIVYPSGDNLDKQLKEKLLTSNFRMAESNKIQFVINDKFLRLYANNILEQKGSFADSSFNSNVVTITPEDMMLLIAHISILQEMMPLKPTKFFKKPRKNWQNQSKDCRKTLA